MKAISNRDWTSPTLFWIFIGLTLGISILYFSWTSSPEINSWRYLSNLGRVVSSIYPPTPQIAENTIEFMQISSIFPGTGFASSPKNSSTNVSKIVKRLLTRKLGPVGTGNLQFSLTNSIERSERYIRAFLILSTNFCSRTVNKLLQ